jgi:hypothetical protein
MISMEPNELSRVFENLKIILMLMIVMSLIYMAMEYVRNQVIGV